MSVWTVPWLELAIAAPLLGALLVSRLRDPLLAFRWGLGATALSLLCACLAWGGYAAGATPASVQPDLFGRVIFSADALNAPIVPMVALLHFLTALATTRTKMRRYSFTWSLASESIRLAGFACTVRDPRDAWVLIALFAGGAATPFIELLNRGRPTRVYVLHMALFVGLLVLGWAYVDTAGDRHAQTAWATVPLFAAILVRSGAVPVHCWVTDWLENASFGNALLYVTPLAGVYLAVRLVLPIAPDWVLRGIGLVSLVTAVYAAGMAAVQRDTRRFFAYLFLSHASLVLVGLELHTPIALTGSMCLWLSAALSLAGFGLVLRALEARVGRVSLTDFHGLYEHSPTLAVCFLMTGLGSVGFPGTSGYVAAELLVDGAIEANLYVGLGVVVASALNGIAVVRAYFLIFTGKRHASTVSLDVSPRERAAFLTVVALILVGGLFPQPIVSSRHRAAESILKDREAHVPRSESNGPDFLPNLDSLQP
jgi:NADH-quinone oxidoreductase subunit M